MNLISFQFFLKRLQKFSLLTWLVMGSAALVTSCGTYLQNDPPAQPLEWKADSREGRFTPSEIKSLFTAETEIIGGKKFPKSKPTIKGIYNGANAPARLIAEYGVFSAGAEMRGRSEERRVGKEC